MTRVLLHLEGLTIFALCLLVYSFGDFRWATFAIFFLLPDVALFAYFVGHRAGSIVYNVAHTYVVPLSIGLWSLFAESEALLTTSLIWTAHIAFDRALGFGLKSADSFKRTHIQRV